MKETPSHLDCDLLAVDEGSVDLAERGGGERLRGEVLELGVELCGREFELLLHDPLRLLSREWGDVVLEGLEDIDEGFGEDVGSAKELVGVIRAIASIEGAKR